jgi:hypothetical protein
MDKIRKETMQKHKSFTRKAIMFVLFLVFVFGAIQAQASIIGYTSRAAFDAAVPGASVQNWDGYAVGTTFINGGTSNGITYNSSQGDAVVATGWVYTTNPNSLGQTVLNYFDAADVMTFSFVSPIRAFGIDINTYSANAGAYQALTNLGDIALSGYDIFPGYNTGQFVGFISNQDITSVAFSAPNGDNYTLDTMRYQSTAPIPGSVLLLGSGLLGLLGWRRAS